MDEEVQELIAKWSDCKSTTDDWTELNLIGEFLEDLKRLNRMLHLSE